MQTKIQVQDLGFVEFLDRVEDFLDRARDAQREQPDERQDHASNFQNDELDDLF